MFEQLIDSYLDTIDKGEIEMQETIREAIETIETMRANELADWLQEFGYIDNDALLIALYEGSYTTADFARARVILKRHCRRYPQAAWTIVYH